MAAAIYFDDLYVDSGLSLQTAAYIPNLRPWVTNEFEHDGLHCTPRNVSSPAFMTSQPAGPNVQRSSYP